MSQPDQTEADAPAASGSATGPGPRGYRSWWSTVLRWRNWRLPVKVGAVLAVPVLAAIVLGAVQITGDVSSANAYARTQRLVALRSSLLPLIGGLQEERWLSAERLGIGNPIAQATFQAQTDAVDKDSAAVEQLGNGLLDNSTPAGIRYQELVGQLAGLSSIHQQVSAPQADVVSVISTYSTLISTILDFDQALTTQFGDVALTGPGTALFDLDVAAEQVTQQQSIVAVAIARGHIIDTELVNVHASDVLQNDRLADFQVVANPDQLSAFQQIVTPTDLNRREQYAQLILGNGLTSMAANPSAGIPTVPLGVSGTDWNEASVVVATELDSVRSTFANELSSTAASLQDQASTRAGIESVVLFAILLLAAGIGVLIGRNLLRSLSLLRRTALDVAQHGLPAAVAAIEAGHVEDAVVAPVPVHTDEELGQVARAFDAVHQQAVRSAIGQASLRSNLRNIFINLSRRSQSLVERQLRLMERLERNEEDPEQLANLFKLDHLATRMRRNNENLMVLSGDDPARRSGQPLPLADVLRAAVSEIDQYQRVVVRTTPGGEVLGYASGDLVRLIAELLDNATSFSPPQTKVVISGRALDNDTVLIDIKDDGIGMADAELTEANQRLEAAGTIDVPVSRQMGLYVVGRLARRHGIKVALRAEPDAGLRAVVVVPAELLRAVVVPADVTETGGLNGSAITAILNASAIVGGVSNGIRPTNGHPVPAVEELFSAPEPEPAPEPVFEDVFEDVVEDVAEPDEWATFRGTAIAEPPAPAPKSARPIYVVAPLVPQPPEPLPGGDFGWFDGPVPPGETSGPQPAVPVAPAPVQPAAVAEPAEPASFTSVGLPRRVPQANQIPPASGLPRRSTPAAPAPAEPEPASDSAGPQRNPARTRGFLSDYQAGIRKGAHRADESSDNTQGWELK